MKTFFYIGVALTMLYACGEDNKKSDAYGNFEAVELLVSAENNGKLIQFTVDEGKKIKKGDTIGFIDTEQLKLRLAQVRQQQKAVGTRSTSVDAQWKVYDQQKKNLLIERDRLAKLVADKAAPQQQLDNIDGQLRVLDQQIEATRTQNASVSGEIETLDAQADQIKDLIQKSYIVNPIDGTVLTKFAEQHEVTAAGKPLYKIADLSRMVLRVFVDGSQLPQIKLGQNVKVLIDKSEKENTELQGTVTWISENAEFTPKIIQTKHERVQLVYAVKVSVPNDGSLKIGMPGEVLFANDQTQTAQ